MYRIIFDSGCGSMIVMGRLVGKLSDEQDAVIQRHIQSGNITFNLKVKTHFTLPTISAMNVVTWTFHVDESYKGRYDMIFGKDMLTEL